MNRIISEFKPLVDERLNALLGISAKSYQSVIDAMNYSVSIGGKRIRPCITMEFARLCSGDMKAALDVACALEMIHTYSLIHDDLPCMDNDDMRRGMPSCHIKFGEDIALLAGDALLTKAFETIADVENQSSARCIKLLSEAAGVNGMIGGQVIDLLNENKQITIEKLTELNSLKTSMLLRAAGMLGCAISGAEEDKLSAASEFGLDLGLAFQIVDDILDIVGDEALLGKPIGSDSDNNKTTFPQLVGLEEASRLADSYTVRALAALDIFGADADALRDLAKELLDRKF